MVIREGGRGSLIAFMDMSVEKVRKERCKRGHFRTPENVCKFNNECLICKRMRLRIAQRVRRQNKEYRKQQNEKRRGKQNKELGQVAKYARDEANAWRELAWRDRFQNSSTFQDAVASGFSFIKSSTERRSAWKVIVKGKKRTERWHELADFDELERQANAYLAGEL